MFHDAKFLLVNVALQKLPCPVRGHADHARPHGFLLHHDDLLKSSEAMMDCYLELLFRVTRAQISDNFNW